MEINYKEKVYKKQKRNYEVEWETYWKLKELILILDERIRNLMFINKDTKKETEELSLDLFIAKKIVNKIDSGEIIKINTGTEEDQWDLDNQWVRGKLEDYLELEKKGK